MGRIAVSSGGAGDIIFSIPIMKSLGISTLYIKESFYPVGFGSMYSALKEIVELQGFEVLPTKDEGGGFDKFEPGLQYDINMDAWRGVRGRGKDHIMLSMMMWFKCYRPDWKRPWLRLDDKKTDLTGSDYSLWYLSPRWRQSSHSWRDGFAKVSGDKYFIGFDQDWEDFCIMVNQMVPWLRTTDFMATARLIRDCRALYCNQGPALAIAQGIAKEYYCAFKTGKTNTMIRMPYEHHLY